jgi:hypothetical protein
MGPFCLAEVTKHLLPITIPEPKRFELFVVDGERKDIEAIRWLELVSFEAGICKTDFGGCVVE